MMPRLLSKPEIARHKSIERQREIDEGMKLAGRVDGLRETAAQEETSLMLFRKKTLDRIGDELIAAAAERTTILAEIKRLNREREEALAPLTAELEAIEAGKKELEARKLELDTRENAVINSEAIVNADRIEAKDTQERAAKERLRARDLLHEAATAKEGTAQKLKEVSLIKEEVVSFKIKTEANLANRENAITEREKSCILKEEQNNRAWEEIGIERKKLRDERATLERALKRSKN